LGAHERESFGYRHRGMPHRVRLCLAALVALSCGEARPWVVFERPSADYQVQARACDGDGRACRDMQVAELFGPTDLARRRILGLQVDAAITQRLSLEVLLGEGDTARCDRLILQLNAVGDEVVVALTAAPPMQPGVRCASCCEWGACVLR
jgi:hypothetical protein